MSEIKVTKASAKSEKKSLDEDMKEKKSSVKIKAEKSDKLEKSEKKPKKDKTDKSEKKNKYVRIEIIFSQAVEEDFFDEFKKQGVGLHYSKVSNVTGAGFSNPKLGDAIWPQVNEIFIIYCKKDEASKIYEIIEKLRAHYPAEGIACFTSKAKMH